MAVRSRRWLLSSIAGVGASAVVAGKTGANSGTQLPQWGDTQGSTSLQAGPLGLNPSSDPGQVPVAMRIPDAGVDAEVEQQKIVDGQMLDPSGPWVVAWYDQSARAGEIGNFLSSGHVDYWEVGESVFHDIAALQEGAQIEIVGKGGATYIYEVEYVQRIDIGTVTVDELNSPNIVGQTDYAAATLITCGGNFNGQEYTQRDIIRARLASVQGGEESPEVVSEDESADAGAEPAETQEPETDAATLAEGGTATVSEDVNMRSEPTTSAEVVLVLTAGTTVTITGASQEADGFVWWPIALDDGTTGWTVADYLTP